MVHSDFDFIAKNKIYPFYLELKSIDEEKTGGKALRYNGWRLHQVYFYYESVRKKIRKLYMPDDDRPMDRHKIAANLMLAMLKARPIKVNRHVPNLPQELLLANEYLAFYTAVSIIEDYKRDALTEPPYQEFKHLADRYILDLFPATYIKSEGSHSYIDNICKALYYTKHYDVENVFAYANIFFWMERYTDDKYGIKLSSES